MASLPTPVVFVQRMIHIYFDRHVSRSSAELAYFMILSFFPILICINAFVGRLQLNVNELLETVDYVLPRQSLMIITDYLAYLGQNQSPALFLGGVTMTLFSASAAVRGLMDVMADIEGHRSYTGLHQIFASVVNSILLLFTIYLSILVLLTGNWLFQLVEEHFPWMALVLSHWQTVRFVLLFCLVLLVVLLLYHMAAPKGGHPPVILPGAFAASSALVAASGLFSWFIGLSSRYALVYGSLTSVILLLIWLYLCGNIVIIGYIINHLCSKRG